jgi:integrase
LHPAAAVSRTSNQAAAFRNQTVGGAQALGADTPMAPTKYQKEITTMPKRRQIELIRCRYFAWGLGKRDKVWWADGRSNPIKAGRHSLNTTDRAEALKKLPQLDAAIAFQHGIGPKPAEPTGRPLLLTDGRSLYEEHIRRPRVVGGVRVSTQKRYRTVFDKFLAFATERGTETWNAVDDRVLTAYATHLGDQGYSGTTLRKELTTLIQAHKWLVQEEHLVGQQVLRLKIKKVESERSYCYTPEEVDAMIAHCRTDESLAWLAEIIIALACTGLRISELASLRWSDVDLKTGRVTLTDESGRAHTTPGRRRELKSGRGRQLPLHRQLANVLKAMPHNDGFVFHGPRGGRLKPDTVRQILVREVIKPLIGKFPSSSEEQGFKDGRLHSFRHYFASTCALNGVSERVAMQWLGHQDSDMVRHYFHLHDAEARRQMERLEPIGINGKRLAGVLNSAESQREEELAQPGVSHD